MSASLVGLGDVYKRQPSLFSLCAGGSGVAARDCAGVCPTGFSAAALLAVSYTHLTLPTICSV
eukprot:3245319-Alexandrium_andersonii.AAC.1